jgi:hypothetical protein
MDKYGNSYPQAYRVLQKMEKAGKLKSRVIVLLGNQTRVYSKSEAT